MVKIPLPPDAYNTCSPLIYTLAAETLLNRIFKPKKYNTQPLTFRDVGPISRFDHHRFPVKDPNQDSQRGILYAAFTLSGCFVEIFGDQRTIHFKELEEYQVAELTVTSDLKLLDLRKNGAMLVGANAALSKIADRDISQKWSRYLYNHPENFEGIIYANAHNDEDAIALYERAKNRLSYNPNNVVGLNDTSLITSIIEITINHNLYLEFS